MPIWNLHRDALNTILSLTEDIIITGDDSGSIKVGYGLREPLIELF
jgi:hypothetical protein